MIIKLKQSDLFIGIKQNRLMLNLYFICMYSFTKYSYKTAVYSGTSVQIDR